jgi:hypothetical protein
VKKDICRLKVESAEECFPGISKSIYTDVYCTEFHTCAATFYEARKNFLRIGAIESKTSSGHEYVLPKGWNNIKAAESVLKERNRKANVATTRYDGGGYRAVNIVFLGTSPFGIALTGAALVANFFEKDESTLEFTDLCNGGEVAVFVGALAFFVYIYIQHGVFGDSEFKD